LEGKTDQSLEKLKASEKWIRGGSATLVAFTVIASAIAILGIALHDLSFGYIAFINLILGPLIGLPLIYFGQSRLKRAGHLLSKSSPETMPQSSLKQSRGEELLTAGLRTDHPQLPAPRSVTEHTTLDLEVSDRARRETQ
jgi:hypothetical protein